MAITEAVARALAAGMTLTCGSVVQVRKDGRIRVRLEGAPGRDVTCDVLRTGPKAPRIAPGDETLVAVAEGAARRPIVIGVVGVAEPEPDTKAVAPDETVRAHGKGTDEQPPAQRQLVIEAGEELTLRCGEASISIRRDGKIVIRGEHILSRAKGTHRIKGGSVAIN